jgi:ATP-dependent Lhr-like helicase
LEPEVSVPFSRDAREWSRDDALIEIIRGRLEGLGPVTTTTLASPLGLKPGGVAVALASLEAEGFAMRGRFSAGATEDEWCERRLLSRIHHYTIRRLRAEIEPVAARDFLRFLFAWQHVDPKTRMAGLKALDAVLAQLEGFEAPAAAWESEILPARLADYDPDWLDERCLAGYLTWMRLRPRGGAGDKKASPLRTTPIAILPRQGSAMWTSLEANGVRPSARAEMVAEQIRRDGASFFHDLLGDTGLLRSQLEEAIAELVALGILTSDSFGGLRALLTPSRERRSHPRRRRRSAVSSVEDAGRWSLVRRNAKPSDDVVEHVARAASALWRGLLAVDRAGGIALAALAGALARLSPAGEPRRDPWRPFRCRIFRRAVRGSGCHRLAARKPPSRKQRNLDCCLGLRPAQPCRHPDSWAKDCCTDRKPRAVPRWCADGFIGRR